MTLSGTVPDKVCKRRKKGRSVGLVRLDGTFFCMLRPLFQFSPPPLGCACNIFFIQFTRFLYMAVMWV